jgi:hypothetical protein
MLGDGTGVELLMPASFVRGYSAITAEHDHTYVYSFILGFRSRFKV